MAATPRKIIYLSEYEAEVLEEILKRNRCHAGLLRAVQQLLARFQDDAEKLLECQVRARANSFFERDRVGEVLYRGKRATARAKKQVQQEIAHATTEVVRGIVKKKLKDPAPAARATK